MSPAIIQSKEIISPIARELDLLEEELKKSFVSTIGLISAIGDHLMSMKGKRIRPALALLSAKLGNPDIAAAVKVGVAVEVVHTATLLHDDSIDRSYLRRGIPTVNKIWNDQVSVIMGDYLFCKAFRLLHDGGLFEAASILSRGSDNMTYGEMVQMDLRGRHDISEDAYLSMIKHKTASLFVSACEAGAVLGGLAKEDRSRLRAYGEHIGIAFQIVDDVLDYVGDVDLMGKPVGNDLRDGRITLPLIAAFRNAGKDGRGRIREIIADGDLIDSRWAEVVDFVENNGGIEYSREVARKFAGKAGADIAGLGACPAKSSLTLLADHVFARQK
jgi:octaprenyl-diphosphate synthase